MPRSPVWGVYVDDDSNAWALLLDGDYFLDPVRGWDSAEGLGLSPLPRGWRPRQVKGIDADGRSRYAIVPSVTAPLWVGEATSFVYETRDGSTVEAVVVELQGERRFSQPPP